MKCNNSNAKNVSNVPLFMTVCDSVQQCAKFINSGDHKIDKKKTFPEKKTASIYPLCIDCKNCVCVYSHKPDHTAKL